MHWALSLPVTAQPSHAEILLSVQRRRCFHSNPVKLFIALAKQSLHLSLLNILLWNILLCLLQGVRAKPAVAAVALRAFSAVHRSSTPSALPMSALQEPRGLRTRREIQVMAMCISLQRSHEFLGIYLTESHLSTQETCSFNSHAWCIFDPA